MNKKPIRILHLIPDTGFGGITTMVMNLYRRIDRNKVQFDFAAFKRGPFHEEITSLGGRIFYFDYIKQQGPISYVLKLRNCINKYGPYFAVHEHSGYKAGFGLLAARMAGVPRRVCHIHTTNVEDSWYKYVIPLLKSFSIKQATKLLACGSEAGDFLYRDREYEVLPNAIQISDYSNCPMVKIAELKKEFNIKEDVIAIGHVGRFSKVKNHKFMVEVASMLKDRAVNYKMIFIGDGPLRMEIEELVLKKHLEDNITFAGIRADIPNMMNIFDVFLFPSIFEGVPVTLLEAQAAAVPCLVSTGVPKECDAEAGLLRFLDLSAGAEEWADNLIALTNKGQVDKNYVASKLSSKGYDLEANVEKLMNVYSLSQ